MIRVIIPTYNKERALPQTLSSVFQQLGPFQMIVVDGGSTDRTQDIAQTFPEIVWLTAPEGRASEMNAGANAMLSHDHTSNDWLLFLHADTLLPSNAFKQLHQIATDPNWQANGFQHEFPGKEWRLQMISWLDNVRCHRSQTIYGDQGLFVRVGLLHQLRGFPLQPMLEDVRFCEKLLAHTRPQLLPSSVVRDAWKFLQMSAWESLLRVVMLFLHVEFGVPTFAPAFFADIR